MVTRAGPGGPQADGQGAAPGDQAWPHAGGPPGGYHACGQGPPVAVALHHALAVASPYLLTAGHRGQVVATYARSPRRLWRRPPMPYVTLDPGASDPRITTSSHLEATASEPHSITPPGPAWPSLGRLSCARGWCPAAPPVGCHCGHGEGRGWG